MEEELNKKQKPLIPVFSKTAATQGEMDQKALPLVSS
jgi:hypothetical protein